MAFEMFKPGFTVARLGKDEVGLGKTGITLGDFWRRMGKPDGVAVAFDRVARIIRLTPCPRHSGGFSVNQKTGSMNLPKKFYEHFEITARGRVRGVEKDGHVLVHLGPAVKAEVAG